MRNTTGRGTTSRSKVRKKARGKTGRRIRYAVIGLGHIAQAAVLPAFAHATRNSTLAALISDDPAKLKRLGAATQYRISPATTMHRRSSQAARSTPCTSLCPIRCISTGRSVPPTQACTCCAKKPMAPSVRACERMLQAAGRNRVRLMIAYRLQFERANLEVAQLVRAGKLGAARYFDAQFSMQVKPGNIRTRADLAGGPLNDIGIYCINARAQRVRGRAAARLRGGHARHGCTLPPTCRSR